MYCSTFIIESFDLKLQDYTRQKSAYDCSISVFTISSYRSVEDQKMSCFSAYVIGAVDLKLEN